MTATKRPILMMRLDAPLMAFGGVMVDSIGTCRDFPSLSMVTGLLASALGWRHREFEKLQALQERIRFAARLDDPGEPVLDYQTVDLGQDFLRQDGWTTEGETESRAGGEAREGTHIRRRHYIAGAVCTLAMELRPPGEEPTVRCRSRALEEPARPLFIGRKCCLPSSPMSLGVLEAPDLLSALKAVPLAVPAAGDSGKRRGQWPSDEGNGESSRLMLLTDGRDWANQVHCGRRPVRDGWIDVRGAEDE